MKKIVLTLIACLFFAGIALPALASDTLNPGDSLTPGHAITSPNGQYQFTLQSDGNIVLYKKSGKKALWNSGTAGKKVTKLLMQADGNLVLYKDKKALWSTGTSGNQGAFLMIQDDGNAVIYTNHKKKAIWSTNTAQ